MGRRLAGSVLVSLWLMGLFKEYLTLPRPDPAVVRHVVTETSPGFPSGHAQGAVAMWGYLALAFRRRWRWGRRWHFDGVLFAGQPANPPHEKTPAAVAASRRRRRPLAKSTRKEKVSIRCRTEAAFSSRARTGR
ncbi:MAG TPA: phosphatase PAP2 family protein, partial [Limnochordales bacterium]